jgi:hypothetical protein
MPKANCGNCAFSKADEAYRDLLCVKSAPVRSRSGSGDAVWPVVITSDWCGEYQPNEKGGAYEQS